MSILINKDTKLIVQGITGRDGSFHYVAFLYSTQLRMLLQQQEPTHLLSSSQPHSQKMLCLKRLMVV